MSERRRTTISEIAVFGSATETNAGLAIVSPSGQTIMLSGPAVTRASVLRLARVLRPV